MNAPERFEMFVLPEGAKKIEITKDPKMGNCLIFILQKEDHTLANILRYKLLKHPQVLFAAYKSPHPLEYYVEVKVQTTTSTTPIAVMKEVIQSLVVEYGNIRSKFENELFRVDASVMDGGHNDIGTSGYGRFGAMDTSTSDFGSRAAIGARPERSDDVDIDF